jgi:hypothetical protein
MWTRLAVPASWFAVVVLVAGCFTGPTGGTATPPPIPAAGITTPEDAMAAVVAVEPRFENVQPRQLDLIGQSAWYEVRPASGVGAFVVAVTVGWGDCQAGCIDAHTWTYAVQPDGTVLLLSEDGPPVPPDVLPGADPDVTTGVTGHATAGPVCPVEMNPPDPACAPRPVAGARVVALDASEQVVAETMTGPDGAFALELRPGDYTIQSDEVDGLMGAPEPIRIAVEDGVVTVVDLAYETGIR